MEEFSDHPDSTGTGLIEHLGEALAVAAGEQPAPRETLYEGPVLVEERERGITTCTLADAPASLPSSVGTRDAVDAAALRAHLRQTQAAMAHLLGVSLRTYQKWEQGGRSPGGAALKLLRLASVAPMVLLREETRMAAYHTAGRSRLSDAHKSAIRDLPDKSRILLANSPGCSPVRNKVISENEPHPLNRSAASLLRHFAPICPIPLETCPEAAYINRSAARETAPTKSLANLTKNSEVVRIPTPSPTRCHVTLLPCCSRWTPRRLCLDRPAAPSDGAYRSR